MRPALNAGYSYRERIVKGAGQTALAYLSGRYRHSDTETWRARFERGEVELRGMGAQGHETLRAGDLLVWHRPPWLEPAVPLHYTPLFYDGSLLAVSKPAGLPTVPAGGFLQHTLLALIERDYSGFAPLHRLGRGTSGLVLFARREARGRILSAWSEVQKHYLALAAGEVPTGEHSIRVPIGPVAHPRLGTLHAANPKGKPAHSLAKVLHASPEHSLLSVQIFTGRPHQIRIHLAALGHPLVGDPLYGVGGLPLSDALPSDTGYFLHAHRLCLKHPLSGLPWEVCAPAPM